MDLKDQRESIQDTRTCDEDITEKRPIIRLPVQQAVPVVPEHEQKSYPTDLTDAQWQRIVPLLPPTTPNGHQHKVEPREVVNGILYIVCGSHDWRSFPRDWPPRGTVYAYFRRWQLDGTLKQIIDALCSEECEAAGHEDPLGAAPGNAVSGESTSDSLFPERDDIHDTAPPIDAPSLQRSTIPTTPIVEANTDEQLEVMRYAECLAAEVKRNNNGSHQEESKKYAEDALRTVTLKGQEFRPFALLLAIYFPLRLILESVRDTQG